MSSKYQTRIGWRGTRHSGRGPLVALAVGLLIGAGCSGSDGATGPAGQDGIQGETGAQGEAGAAGEAGQDAEPCTVADNGDGTFGIDCPDGTSVTLTNGADGGDCSATDNGDGSYDLVCGNDTVTVSDGTNGADGTNGESPLVVTANATEAECGTLGGMRIEVGFDTSGDGILDASEVDSSTVVCRSQSLDGLVDPVRLERRLGDLQAIADANPGVLNVPSRAAGSAGEAATFDYIKAILEPHYRITEQTYDFVFFSAKADAELEQTAPTATTYTPAQGDATNDFVHMRFSAPADVTAEVAAIDVVDATNQPPNTSTSGCELEDFYVNGDTSGTSLVTGKIALMQRGTCYYQTKVTNAQAAGAVGAIVFNEGQAGRTDNMYSFINEGVTITIPVMFASHPVANGLITSLNSGQTVTLRMKVDAVREMRSSKNLFADSYGGDPGRVVMVTAHVDSTINGPGINDNGTGIVTALELAELMAARGITPQKKVRFAFFSGEEVGYIGSNRYMDSIPDYETFLSFDMVFNLDTLGSPNFARFYYDAAGEGANAEVIQNLTAEYFDNVAGLDAESINANGRSDHAIFSGASIPAGGLFTGLDHVKTANQATLYGGTAGQAMDACGHKACDDFSNVDLGVHATMTRAAAWIVNHFVMSQDPVRCGDVNFDQLCDDADPDGDTVTNLTDLHPFDPFICADADNDGCDDCAVTGGPPDPSNDGC